MSPCPLVPSAYPSEGELSLCLWVALAWPWLWPWSWVYWTRSAKPSGRRAFPKLEPGCFRSRQGSGMAPALPLPQRGSGSGIALQRSACPLLRRPGLPTPTACVLVAAGQQRPPRAAPLPGLWLLCSAGTRSSWRAGMCWSGRKPRSSVGDRCCDSNWPEWQSHSECWALHTRPETGSGRQLFLSILAEMQSSEARPFSYYVS